MDTNKDATNKPIRSYCLSEISKWQLDSNDSEVELPPLQRGFVWKVQQIEQLWDSILRGFPIGSFLLSKDKNDKLLIFDGQQRAKSISFGFYDPWHTKGNENTTKNIPVVWIDLSPNELTNTHKFVIRVVTQSHPWGYQRKYNSEKLSVSDRKDAFCIFRQIDGKENVKYTQLDPQKIFPYDSDLPVPLPFLLKAIYEHEKSWKDTLIQMCNDNLLIKYIKTKHSQNPENYLKRLSEILNNLEFGNNFLIAVKNSWEMQIPCIIVKKEILMAEDEQHSEEQDDPTLFLRLNSSGTTIEGEELIYSIYKASFPETKKLVEKIAASFIAPSLVISLVSRLAWAEINEEYPYPINVDDFRKRIKEKDEKFKYKLRELIGEEESSPAKLLFNNAFEILLSQKDFKIPPILVKNIIKGSPDLFLMLLQWIKKNDDKEISNDKKRRILTAITALSWFGTDNKKYVRVTWGKIDTKEFWSKEILYDPYLNKYDFITYPLIDPSTLRSYLLKFVVENKILWEELKPDQDSEIDRTYRNIFNAELQQEPESETDGAIDGVIEGMWNNFRHKLFRCKSLVLFAQREYINQSFDEFNSMETLEDTNSPWDWDHIYPSSMVYGTKNTDRLTRNLTYSIGNLRALSLEQNRSDGNRVFPDEKLRDDEKLSCDEKCKMSFVKENDREYWNKIKERIYEGEEEKVRNHSNAIIQRLCNIYEEWYNTLNVGELFSYED